MVCAYPGRLHRHVLVTWRRRSSCRLSFKRLFFAYTWFCHLRYLLVNVFSFSEALIGLLLVALLMAYLPTMYAAFSRREQAVNMLEVRAGNPPSALEMLLRFNRIHGLDKLADYWKTWEVWFADLEEATQHCPRWYSFVPRALIIHGSHPLVPCWIRLP